MRSAQPTTSREDLVVDAHCMIPHRRSPRGVLCRVYGVNVIEVLALAVVAGAALFFLALGGVALLAPSRASRFLLGFAATPSKHYAELAVRFLVGTAFIISAPRALHGDLFSIFGWLLLGTTAALVLIPWRWHRSFASRAVPEALRFLPLIGVCSAVLGVLVLWAVWEGNTL